VGFLGAVCLLAVTGGQFVVHAMALRLPACTLIGLSLLTTVLPNNTLFDKRGPNSFAAIALMFVVGTYLIIEAGAHRIVGRRLFLRSIGVLALATLYALSISIAVVSFIVPVLRVKHWPALDDPNDFSSIVFSTAAGSLLIGLFLQVMWDDRPVTAALGRRTWRSQP
jgi:hypothetical protein